MGRNLVMGVGFGNLFFRRERQRLIYMCGERKWRKKKETEEEKE